MTLWNLIRDFFVINIFGGVTSTEEFFSHNIVGYINQVSESGSDDNLVCSTGDFVLSVSNISNKPDNLNGSINMSDTSQYFLSMGDWLSTTFTIITLILLVIFLYIFVKWIFKLFSGLLH